MTHRRVLDIYFNISFIETNILKTKHIIIIIIIGIPLSRETLLTQDKIITDFT